MFSGRYAKPVEDTGVFDLDESVLACESMTKSALFAWMESPTSSCFAESMCDYRAPLPAPPSDATIVAPQSLPTDKDAALEALSRITDFSAGYIFTEEEAAAWRTLMQKD